MARVRFLSGRIPDVQRENRASAAGIRGGGRHNAADAGVGDAGRAVRIGSKSVS